MKRVNNPYVYTTVAEVGALAPQLDVQLMPQFAQCGEDYLALSMLRALAFREGLDLTHARYLEIGANHPIASSATYLLHVGLGMTGVLVEANPHLVEELKTHRIHDRVLQHAITPDAQAEVEFFISSFSELSSINAEHIENFEAIKSDIVQNISVPARTLDQLLEAEFRGAPPLFMSIDIEGADFDVLQSWSFSMRPYIIQIEANEDANAHVLNDVSALLNKHNYGIIASTDVNQLAVDMNRFRLGDLPKQPEADMLPHQLPASTMIESLGVAPGYMHKLLEPFEILTLDVFDTILARRGVAPTDVFAWMEHHLDRPGFCEARIAAEAAARKKHAARGQEISLEEIYECFPETHQTDRHVLEQELEAERKFLFLNKNIYDLISVAKCMGKRVVAISDIYLSAGQVKALLVNAGIHVDEVYTSADFRDENLGKYNNRLFPRILELEGVAAGAILHIGDNVRSDLEHAHIHGIAALHTRNLHELVCELDPIASFVIDTADTRTGSIVAGQITKDLVQRSAPRGMHEEFGYAVGGPLVLGYLQYIQHIAQENGIDHLVLLERDGCIIADAAEQFPKLSVPWRLAPSSRRMTALPCLARGDSTPLERLFQPNPISEADFFDALTLPRPAGLDPEGGRVALAQEHISKHGDLLKAQADNELRALQSELQKELEIVANGGKIAWVDVGWGLSSAAALNKALDLDAPCFCIGSNLRTPSTLKNYGYLFEYEQPDEIGRPITLAPEPVELIFSSTRPSTAYLTERDGKMERVTKSQLSWELLRNGAIEDTSRGVLNFIADIQDLYPGLNPDELRAHNRSVISGFCAMPPRAVYKALARVPHDRLAGDQAWSTIGDFWRPHKFLCTIDAADEMTKLKKKIVEARKHPMRLIKAHLTFKILRQISRWSPPLPKRMTERFSKSAKKRDPNRDAFLN